MFQGIERVKKFYDDIGWREQGGVTADARLFGDREQGALRSRACAARVARIKQRLSEAGPSLRLLECGCGANPEVELLDLCAHYTGVDVSPIGLEVAARKLAERV